MLAVLLTGLDFLPEHEDGAEGADTSANQIRLGGSTERFSQGGRDGARKQCQIDAARVCVKSASSINFYVFLTEKQSISLL